jgi:hypothetical protein
MQTVEGIIEGTNVKLAVMPTGMKGKDARRELGLTLDDDFSVITIGGYDADTETVADFVNSYPGMARLLTGIDLDGAAAVFEIRL